MNILKKVIVTLFITGLMFLPLGVKAEEKTYTAMNLDGALTEEEIEHDFSDYSENDDQAIIYLFRGKGCGYCRKFLTFINSIIDDYGKYFKVVSYEVWNDEANSELLARAAATMKQEAGGVPYIVIGDKVFAGYAESYDEDIKEAIKTLYDTDKSERYDLMEHLVDASEVQQSNGESGATGETNASKDSSSNFSLIVFNIIFTLAACTVVVVYENKKRIELENRILLLEGKKIKKDEE